MELEVKRNKKYIPKEVEANEDLAENSALLGLSLCICIVNFDFSLLLKLNDLINE